MGGGISNSQSITKEEEGKYALDAVQNNPDVDGSLRNELGKRITSGRVYYTSISQNNVDDGDVVDIPITLPIGGIFLVEAYIAACEANASTKDSPFFEFQIIKNNNPINIGYRKAISINIAKVWDYANVTTFTANVPSGDIIARFTSYMGSKLNSTYDSAFGVKFTSLQ